MTVRGRLYINTGPPPICCQGTGAKVFGINREVSDAEKQCEFRVGTAVYFDAA